MMMCAGAALVCMQAGAQAAAPGSADRDLINVVAVGYDIENNPKAQQMLQEMAQAARDTGAGGTVIMAGQDEAQLDQAMQKAMTIATQPPAPAYRLELKTKSAAPGATITVVHTDFPAADRNAWIAFYEKAGDRDQDYLCYTFLANLTERTYDVRAPDKPGDEYHFRLFLSKEYDCAARSEAVRVAE